MMQKLRAREGMTMIEMIGVLGVIAVLSALLIPRVFDVITDSKIDSLATATHTYASGDFVGLSFDSWFDGSSRVKYEPVAKISWAVFGQIYLSLASCNRDQNVSPYQCTCVPWHSGPIR